MKTHKRLLGICYLLLSTFYIVLSTVLMVLVFITTVFTSPESLSWYVTDVIPVVSTLLLLISIPGMICGIGLLYQKVWIEQWVPTIGLLFLPFFPLGTLLGIYTLLTFNRFRKIPYRSI